MDIYRRFLNPHVFLQLLPSDSPLKASVASTTRLVSLITDPQLRQKLKEQELIDQIEAKQQSISHIMGLSTQSEIQEYLNDNLYIAEESYNACVILFDLGQYETALRIAEKVLPACHVERFEHLRPGFLWAKMNVLAIQAIRSKDKHIEPLVETMRDIIGQEQFLKNFKARADLLHLGLLLLIDEPSAFLEIFANDSFLDVAYSVAPYMFFYYCAALVLTRGQSNGQLNLSQIAQQAAKINCNKVLVKFIEDLIGKFNFDEALKHLGKIQQEAEQDWLIAKHKQSLQTASKLLFLNTYLRIFNSFEKGKFIQQLQLEDENELVHLIKQLNPNNKIEIEGERVSVQKADTHAQNTQMQRQIRELIQRTNNLTQNIQKLVK